MYVPAKACRSNIPGLNKNCHKVYPPKGRWCHLRVFSFYVTSVNENWGSKNRGKFGLFRNIAFFPRSEVPKLSRLGSNWFYLGRYCWMDSENWRFCLPRKSVILSGPKLLLFAWVGVDGSMDGDKKGFSNQIYYTLSSYMHNYLSRGGDHLYWSQMGSQSEIFDIISV